jgi:uncharacterized membrane protein YfcA
MILRELAAHGTVVSGLGAAVSVAGAAWAAGVSLGFLLVAAFVLALVAFLVMIVPEVIREHRRQAGRLPPEIRRAHRWFGAGLFSAAFGEPMALLVLTRFRPTELDLLLAPALTFALVAPLLLLLVTRPRVPGRQIE